MGERRGAEGGGKFQSEESEKVYEGKWWVKKVTNSLVVCQGW